MVGRTLTAPISMVLILAFSPSVSGDPQENTMTLGAVGQIGGPIQGVAVQDSIAYITVGPRLMAMQVSESGSLVELGGTRPLPSFLRDVTISGSFAYVAAGDAGIFVVDVTDPSEPAILGNWDSPGYAEAVAVDGTVVYVADGPYGLRIVDVSDAANPVEVSWAFPFHYAMDVAVSDGIAAIASVTAGVFFVDVSDPAEPVERGSLLTGGCAFGIDSIGRAVYLADGWGGLVIVDVSRPGSPQVSASYTTPGWAMDVAVDDGVAYVGDGYKGLRVLDVSAPSAPVERGAFEFEGHAVKASVSGGRVFLIDKPAQVRVIDILDPSQPSQLSSYASAAHVEDVAVSGNYAYLASGASGMHVVDVSDPSTPRQVAQFDTQGYAFNVSVVGELALVTTFTMPTGLAILDISDPGHPSSVSFFPQQHATYFDMEISGSIAFMPDEMGLAAVDFSDPAQPFEIGWIDLDGYGDLSGTSGVGVDGNVAAVAQTESGTVFVDISDPSDMNVLGRFGSAWAWNATLQADTAYIGDLGLLVLDASDPKNPDEVAFSPLPGGDGRDVVLDGTVAYLTFGDTGILAFDMSDPRDPIVVADFDSPGYANKAVIENELLFVADGDGGLLVLDTLSTEQQVDAARRLSKSSSRTDGSRGIILGPLGGDPAEDSGGERFSTSASFRIDAPLHARRRKALESSKSEERRLHPLRARRDGAADESHRKTLSIVPGRRASAATCEVINTADSGDGSLRWCMDQAQNGDTIVFDSAVFPPDDPATILLSSELPQITQGGLTIDASDSGVILDGQDLDIAGINIGSDVNTVRGLQIYRCGGPGIVVLGNRNVIGGNRSVGSGPVGQGNVLSENGTGVSVWECSYNIISGNLIGTDVTGRHARGNEDHGISVRAGDNSLIGGLEPGERNIVSANGGPGIALGPGVGIEDNSYDNRVIGNYVGTDIDGEVALGNGENGIILGLGPFGNLIEGNVCSGNSGEGIVIVDPGTSYNSVVGNIIGLDSTGSKPMGNGRSGIYIGLTSAWFNRVGGTLPKERNIVSGHQREGITVAGHDQFVIGNYIGTDITGTRAIGNGDGVSIGLSKHSFVGGTRKQERNVVSGNSKSGVMVDVSFNNMVMGNFIGVDASGTLALQNGEAASLNSSSLNIFQGNVISGNWGGVTIREGSERNLLRANRVGVAAEDTSPIPNGLVGVWIESASNLIGGSYPGDGNIIANNQGGGVEVWTASGNSILGNSIYGNNSWGIHLVDGGNDSLSSPEINRADAFSISGTACARCIVDIFSDEHEQGRIVEGSTVADGDGSFEFSTTVPFRWPCITSTVTDADGNTSEFSDPTCLTRVRRAQRRVAP